MGEDIVVCLHFDSIYHKLDVCGRGMHTCKCGCPQKLDEAIRAPGTRVTGSCECWEHLYSPPPPPRDY